jgi:D-alanyl-D-alanine carboxypeptidase (penicillin-binding protein 5/6)
MLRVLGFIVLLVIGGGGWYAFLNKSTDAPVVETTTAPPGPLKDSATAPLAGGGTAPSPLAVRLDLPGDPVAVKFKKPPRSALLFDLDTGRVLWRRDPTRVLPIASLTKMMTALVVVDRVKAGSKVLVTKQAVHYESGGSAVGLLPKGKWIGVNTMLYGLMLPSGNDAAIALAQRAAGGSERRFVRYMNEKAQQLGLVCTHFSTPSGFRKARRSRSPTRRCATRAQASACCRGASGSASTRCSTACCCRRATTPRSRSPSAPRAAASGASCAT